MAVYTRFRLFLGLVGFMSLIMLSLYQVDILQGNTAPQRIYLQERAKQQLREMCDRYPKEFSNRRIEDMKTKELRNFIVDDKNGIIYCYIPKVACTNWKRVMIVLRQGEPYRDPMYLKGPMVHESPMIKYLGNNSRPELKAKLKHYTKFLFVRDPFVRLISAYRNKFLQYKKPFYDLYGRLMLIRYDFIGHQETLQEDAEDLLKMLKLDDVIKFPTADVNVTTQDFVLKWFKSVPMEERRKLYQMYMMDFKLFGYPKPVELLGG